MKRDRLGRLSLATAAFSVASAVLAQPAPAPPKFDVISVKPCTEGAAKSAGGGRGPADSRTARLHLPCQTVKNLILQAYFAYTDGRVHPPPFPPLEGGPSWIESAHYIIDATSEAAATHAMP